MPGSSLTVALHSVKSSLQSSMSGIGATASNMANINTEGYSRKSVTQEAYISGNGEGGGVRTSAQLRITDQRLVDDVHVATSELVKWETKDYFLGRVEKLLGNPNGETAFTKKLSKFAISMQGLSANPADVALHRQTVNDAVNLARGINDIANGIQQIRGEVDKDISDTIIIVNKELENIQSLNLKISLGKSNNQSVGALEDARDLAIGKISDILGVKTSFSDDGGMSLFMQDGTPLVNQVPYFMSYTGMSSMNPSIAYPTEINGIMLGGRDVTNLIKSGKLNALIELRDKTLPNRQEELDSLTKSLCNEINTIHNKGTGLPPPTELVGTRAVVASDVFNGTGMVRLSFLDDAGKFASMPIELDLSEFSTIQELMDKINTITGTQTITLTSGSSLKINGGDKRISIVSLGDPAVESVTGKEFSDYFGLNDLFITSPTSDLKPQAGLANGLYVRTDIAQNPSFLARAKATTSGEVNVPPNGQEKNQIGISNILGDIALEISEKLTRSGVLFGAAGSLTPYEGSFIDYTSTILTIVSTDSDQASKEIKFNQSISEDLKIRLSEISGVNEEQELANLVLYQQTYKASAKLMQTIDDLLEITIGLLR